MAVSNNLLPTTDTLNDSRDYELVSDQMKWRAGEI